MKRWINFLGLLAIIIVLTSFAYRGAQPSVAVVPEELIVKDELIAKITYADSSSLDSNQNAPIVFLDRSFIGFKEALAFKESQGDYDTINTLGYLGKYQFGRGTLKLMGVYDPEAFLDDPVLQESVFQMNIARNKWILRRDIKRFVGKKINGVTITESGIVAAAHLAGAGNVKKYLRSYGQQDFSDAYGSSVAYYMRKFAGYDISEIKPVHNPRV